MCHWLRGLTAMLVGLSVLILWAPETLAGDESATIAIRIEGPQAQTFRSMIVDLVPEGVEVQEEGRLRQGLAQSGLPGGKMGFAIVNRGMRPKLFKLVQKTINRQELTGAIIGRVKPGRAGPELLLVYLEAEGDPIVDEAAPLKGTRDDQSSAIEEILAPAFEELAPEPEEEEEEEEEPEEQDGDEEEEEEEEEEDEPFDFDAHQVGSELFSLEAGVEFGGRSFAYTDPVTDNLRPYDVFGVPAIALGGEIYPAATTGITVLRDVGVSLSYMHALGLSSQTADGRYLFGTSWNRFHIGLRYRIRFGEPDDNPVVLNLDGRYGFLNFTFEAENEESAAIVDEIGTVGYSFMRLGVDARLPIGSVFALLPKLGYDGPLSGGDVYDRFNGASLGAIDMGLAFALVLGSGFETRAGLDYLRIFSSFEPQVGNAYVAGGALDEYISLKIALGYVF
jgi:hypothetical protein